MSGLRVWHVQNMPSRPILYSVDCVEEAIALLDALINIDLNDKTIESNAFGLEEYDPMLDWTEWYSEEGDDIMTIMREMDNED